MKSVQHKLQTAFWIPVVVCLIMIVLYETGLCLEGNWADDKVLNYYCALAMELVTICLIPLALWFFRWGPVKRTMNTHGDRGLLSFGLLRIVMLALPMMVNTWLYYQFINVAFGYMGIIGLLCMAFIYPSAARCEAESKA